MSSKDKQFVISVRDLSDGSNILTGIIRYPERLRRGEHESITAQVRRTILDPILSLSDYLKKKTDNLTEEIFWQEYEKLSDIVTAWKTEQPPVYSDQWIYPIAMVVTRQMKLGEQTLERQIHSYTAVDGSKYNVQDDLRRKNPTLLEQELREQARHNIHRFQKKFMEFKDAEFAIHFVYPDEVDPKW